MTWMCVCAQITLPTFDKPVLKVPATPDAVRRAHRTRHRAHTATRRESRPAVRYSAGCGCWQHSGLTARRAGRGGACVQGFASVQGRLNALIRTDPITSFTHEEKALFWNNRHFLVVRCAVRGVASASPTCPLPGLCLTAPLSSCTGPSHPRTTPRRCPRSSPLWTGRTQWRWRRCTSCCYGGRNWTRCLRWSCSTRGSQTPSYVGTYLRTTELPLAAHHALLSTALWWAPVGTPMCHDSRFARTP